MIGNDVNLDIFQLAECLSGTTEVSNILAKYLEWDRAPRRIIYQLSQELELVKSQASLTTSSPVPGKAM